MTSKIQFKPEVLELRGYSSFSLVEFYDITYIYVFEVGEFNGDTSRILPLPVDLENPVWTGKYSNFEVTHLFLWWNFMILPIFISSRSRNSKITLSEFYHHRLTSKIQFEPEVLELRGYPSFSLVEFYDITYIYVFEVGEFNGDTFRILLPPVDLENPAWTESTRTLRLPIFFSGGILWYYLDFRGQPVVVEFWKCHHWIPRPRKHKYR